MEADRPRSGIRLTDAEREHAADRLAEAHGEGRISLDELDSRLAAVYRAEVAGDLEPLLADVPTDRERRLLSGQAQDVELRPGPAGLLREGRWLVPRRLRIDQSAWPPGQLGPNEITLDFRTAVLRRPQVEIDLRIVGSAQLVLPAGGTADLSGLRGPGGLLRTDVPTERSAGGVHLVVRGTVTRRRSVRVSYRRRPRWWSTLTM